MQARHVAQIVTCWAKLLKIQTAVVSLHWVCHMIQCDHIMNMFDFFILELLLEYFRYASIFSWDWPKLQLDWQFAKAYKSTACSRHKFITPILFCPGFGANDGSSLNLQLNKAEFVFPLHTLHQSFCSMTSCQEFAVRDVFLTKAKAWGRPLQ